MRYQGKITTWKDDRGFGFITQNGDGNQIFVHIKAFSNRIRRPVGDEIVTYELGIDSQGRARAKNVAFIDQQTETVISSQDKAGLATAFAAVFFVLLITLTAVGRLPTFTSAFYLGASVLTYYIYKADKEAAQNGRQRTPENTLHLLALIGGWCGALIAQQRLRHKSKKEEFLLVFWLTVILNCGVLGWLLTPQGSNALHSLLSGTLRPG